ARRGENVGPRRLDPTYRAELHPDNGHFNGGAMRRMRYLMAAIVIVGFVGCGGDGLKRVPVTGKVTAKGEPVGNATISFIPTDATRGEGGIGTTDSMGVYVLTGSRRGDTGVVPGQYKVRVSRFMDRDGTILTDFKEADNPHARQTVPAPYSSPDTKLVVTVPEQGGTLDIELPVKLLGKK
ncbi:MAG TPA: carboxypeptidase-like regulatory domain-containing protein, partial [Fimbriiglobus sp.]|nr:carboxypeptidase-like regulatory domain-containing protein [Fimbriiglobus sp.]